MNKRSRQLLKAFGLSFVMLIYFLLEGYRDSLIMVLPVAMFIFIGWYDVLFPGNTIRKQEVPEDVMVCFNEARKQPSWIFTNKGLNIFPKDAEIETSLKNLTHNIMYLNPITKERMMLVLDASSRKTRCRILSHQSLQSYFNNHEEISKISKSLKSNIKIDPLDTIEVMNDADMSYEAQTEMIKSMGSGEKEEVE